MMRPPQLPGQLRDITDREVAPRNLFLKFIGSDRIYSSMKFDTDD